MRSIKKTDNHSQDENCIMIFIWQRINNYHNRISDNKTHLEYSKTVIKDYLQLMKILRECMWQEFDELM